jgi:hypothetical protein
VLVGGVGRVYVAGAVHDAGHPAEVDKEPHVRAVGDALDRGLLSRRQLVGALQRFADRGVGGNLGGRDVQLAILSVRLMGAKKAFSELQPHQGAS